MQRARDNGYAGSRSQLARIGAQIHRQEDPQPKAQHSGLGLLATLSPASAAANIASGLSHGHVPSIGDVATLLPGIGALNRATGNIVQATATHPGAVLGHTATGLGSIIAGTPAGLAELAVGTASTHPLAPWKRLVSASASDFSRRYSPLLTGDDAAFRKRITAEGLAPELLDATAAFGGTAAIAGRGATKLAKAGQLGARAERIATARPLLRISGDLAVPQDIHPNLFRAAGQAAQDTARSRRLARRNARAVGSEQGLPGLQARPTAVARSIERQNVKRARTTERGAQDPQALAALKTARQHEASVLKEITPPAVHPRDVPAGGLHDVAPDKAVWFHGTGSHFEGMPTAKGQWSDLGVYVTSDPRYAAKYAGEDPGARVLALRASPKKVLDWRAGHYDTAGLKSVVDQMRARLDEALPVAAKRNPYSGSRWITDQQARYGERFARLDRAIQSGAKDANPEIGSFVQSEMEQLSRDIGEMQGLKGTGNHRQVLREAMQSAGYDAVRKLDQGHDALVVLDESKLRPVTADASRLQAAREARVAAERRVRDSQVRRPRQPLPPLEVPTQYTEVAPFSNRLARRAQTKAVSRTKALSYARNKREQTAELSHGVERDMAGLSRAQRQAVFHATQGIIPIHRAVGEATPDFIARVREGIDARRQQIIKDRNAAGLKPEGPRVLAQSSELRTLDFLDKNAEKVFADGKVAAFHGRNVGRSRRLARLDPGVRNDTAALHPYKVQGHVVGEKYNPPEDAGAKAAYDAQFVARVKAKAKAQGLPDPAYFHHAKRFAPSFADRTASNVMRAVAGPKQSELKLFREGRAVTNPELFVQGLAKNIKRRHQWQAVVDAADQHVFKNLGTGSIDQIKTRIERQGLNVSDFAFYNPRLPKDTRAGAGATAEHDTGLIHKAYDSATAAGTSDEIAALPESFRKTGGFVAIPRAVHDEIASSTRPAGKPIRVIGKAQGIQSAAILGLSPSWLQMQVAANTLLTGLATKGNLKDLAAAQAWHRALPADVRAHLEPATGIGAFEGSAGQPHLGFHQGRLARAAERIGQTPIVRTPRGTVRVTDANPVNLMFRADNAQNNLFRRTVLYNGVKREAFKRMQRELGSAQTAQARVSQLLKLKPGEQLDAQMKRILNNPRDVEKLAQHVDNVLGDYLKYTSRERTAFRPFIMFYGFMRYALRTLFYTLPVHHPIASALVAKVGQLHDEEIRKIFGTRDVPPWVMSRLFLYDKNGNVRRNAKGEIESIDLARINPVTTPVTDVLQESTGHTNAQGKRVGGVNLAPILGLASPLIQAALDQGYARNSFTGQGFHVKGSAEDNPSPDLGTRGRIVANQILSSAFPYREAKKLLYPARQGDDSLLGSPRPIRYKTAGTQAKEAQRRAGLPSVGAQLASDLAPLAFPRPDTTESYLRTHPGAGRASGPPAGMSRGEYEGLLREARAAARESAPSRAETESLLREARAAARGG